LDKAILELLQNPKCSNISVLDWAADLHMHGPDLVLNLQTIHFSFQTIIDVFVFHFITIIVILSYYLGCLYF